MTSRTITSPILPAMHISAYVEKAYMAFCLFDPCAATLKSKAGGSQLFTVHEDSDVSSTPSPSPPPPKGKGGRKGKGKASTYLNVLGGEGFATAWSTACTFTGLLIC